MSRRSLASIPLLLVAAIVGAFAGDSGKLRLLGKVKGVALKTCAPGSIVFLLGRRIDGSRDVAKGKLVFVEYGLKGGFRSPAAQADRA